MSIYAVVAVGEMATLDEEPINVPGAGKENHWYPFALILAAPLRVTEIPEQTDVSVPALAVTIVSAKIFTESTKLQFTESDTVST